MLGHIHSILGHVQPWATGWAAPVGFPRGKRGLSTEVIIKYFLGEVAFMLGLEEQDLAKRLMDVSFQIKERAR